MEATYTDAYMAAKEMDCPYCGAPANSLCRTKGGEMRTMHKARMEAGAKETGYSDHKYNTD